MSRTLKTFAGQIDLIKIKIKFLLYSYINPLNSAEFYLPNFSIGKSFIANCRMLLKMNSGKVTIKEHIWNFEENLPGAGTETNYDVFLA